MTFLKSGAATTAAICLTLLGNAAQAMPTLVGVPMAPVAAGSSFTVILQDTDIADGYDASIDMYLADFLLTFDDTRLSLTVTPDAALPPDWFPTPDTATAQSSGAWLQVVGTPIVPSGPLNLFSLEFTALTTGVADFSVSAPALGSYGAGVAAYADVAASAAIQDATTPRDLPEPQSLALMALAGLGAFAARRRSSTSR